MIETMRKNSMHMKLRYRNVMHWGRGMDSVNNTNRRGSGRHIRKSVSVDSYCLVLKIALPMPPSHAADPSKPLTSQPAERWWLPAYSSPHSAA